MKLNSPRKDPYSAVNQIIDRMKEQGFEHEFSVQDETTLKGNGKTFAPAQVTIDEVERVIDDKNESQSEMVVAISCEDGTKGILKTPYGQEVNETVLKFLAEANEKQNFANFFN